MAERELKPILTDDFSGGENTVTSPHLLKPNQVQQAINVILDEHGALRARDGTLQQGAISPHPDRPIVKLYDFSMLSSTAGVGTQVRSLAVILGWAIAPGTVISQANTLWRRDTTPWSHVGVFQQYYQIPDIVTFTNLAICAGGNENTLMYTDGTPTAVGTVLGTLTGAPNAAHVAVHLGFLWAGNTKSITTSTTGPSSISMSDLNNPNSWPGANQTFVAKDDGQSITALSQYTIAESGISPTATLIIWKDFSGYEATGVLGATSFSLQKIKSDMGCVAPRSVQFVSGFGIIRLTHRGFALYDGVNDTLISEEERPRIFGRDAYSGIDWSNVGLSMSAQCANPPLYICACPISGSAGALQRVFVFDLVRRSWTILTYAHDLATAQLILDANQLPQVLFGDFEGGAVRRAFAGDTTDDQVPIQWTVVTRAYEAHKGGLSRAYWRRLLAKVYGITTTTTITSTFFTGPSGNQCLRSQTLAVSGPPCVTGDTVTGGWSITPWSTGPWSGSFSPVSPGWGNDPWGTYFWGSVAGSNPALTNTDVELNFSVGLIANNLTVQLSGIGPAKIRGLELHAKAKPLTTSTLVGA